MSVALNKISQRIKAVKLKRASKNRPNSVSKGMSGGMEFVSSILVGCFLGWAIDQWLDTKPVFFLIGIIFGVAAGGLTIYKLSVKIASDDKKYLDEKYQDEVSQSSSKKVSSDNR